MESAPYGAVEACTGWFAPVSVEPRPPNVRDAPLSDVASHIGLGSSSNSRNIRSGIKRSGSCAGQCQTTVTGDLLSVCNGKVEHPTASTFGPREDHGWSIHERRQQWQLLGLESHHTHESDQREESGEAIVGVDIPGARAHITCLMTPRALEIYDSSPCSRFLSGPQDHVHTHEKGAGTAAVVGDATAAATSSAAAEPEEVSAHMEAALANAAATVPVLPCLLRIDLAAPLLSRALFDAILSHEASDCAAIGSQSSGTSRSTYANPRSDSSSSSDCSNSRDSSSDGGSSSDSGRSTCREHRCRHSAAVNAGGNRPLERRDSRAPRDDSSARGDIRESNCAPQDGEDPGGACLSRNSWSGHAGLLGDCCCCTAFRLKGENETVEPRVPMKVRDRGGERRVETYTAVKEKIASADEPGITEAAAASTLEMNRHAATGETGAKIEFHSVTHPSREMQRPIGLNAPASTFGRRITRGRCLTQPIVTLSFFLANGELHLVHLTVREISSQQQQFCTSIQTSKAEERCRTTGLPLGASAAALRPRQLVLLMLSHISVMFTQDPMRLTLRVKSEFSTERLTKKVTFHPFKSILNSQTSNRQGLLKSPQLTEQQRLSEFCLQHHLTHRKQDATDQTLQRHQPFQKEGSRFCDIGEPLKVQCCPPAAEASVELASHILYIPETAVTASPAASFPDVDAERASSIRQQMDKTVFVFSRMLLLSSEDLLLEHREASVYGVLRFRRRCRSATNGRGRDAGSRLNSNKEDSACAQSTTRVADVDAVGAWVKEWTQRNPSNPTTGKAGSQGTGKEANHTKIMSGQPRESVCGRRDRRLKRSRAGSHRIWELLASVWNPWKRYRAGSLRRSSVGHNDIASAASLLETGNDSPDSSTQSQSNAIGDSSTAGTIGSRPSPFWVISSCDRRRISDVGFANASSTAIAAGSYALRCCIDSQAAQENVGVTLDRKLARPGLVPYVHTCAAGQQREEKQQQTYMRLCRWCKRQRRIREDYMPMGRIYGCCGPRTAGGKGAVTAASRSVTESPQRSLEENRFLYLLTAAQHVVRLPHAAPHAQTIKGRNNNSLVATCSVVSTQQQQHWRQSQRLSRRHGEDRLTRPAQTTTNREDAALDSDGNATRQRLLSSSLSDELEIDAETRQQGHTPEVVIAVWKVGTVHRRSQHAGGQGLVMNSSATSRAAARRKNDARSLSSGARRLYMRTGVEYEEIPSVQLVCEYVYRPEGISHGVMPPAPFPAASPSSSITMRPEENTKAKTYPRALSSQQGCDVGPACATQKGKKADGSFSTGLTEEEVREQIDSGAGIPINTGVRSCATTAGHLRIVESFHVAPALPSAAVEPAQAAATGGAAWWFGVVVNSFHRDDSDFVGERKSHNYGRRRVHRLSEGISRGCVEIEGGSSSSSRSGDTCREFLLLRCRANGSPRDDWELEKAGQLSWSENGVWRLAGAGEVSSPTYEGEQSRSQEALNKRGRDVEGESARECPHGSPARRFAGFAAAHKWSTVQVTKHCPTGQKQHDTLLTGHESGQCNVVWKEKQSRLLQRPNESEIKVLLTSTYLWFISMKAPPVENVYEKEYGPKGTEEIPRAESAGSGPWCCCPRRVMWAVPLPPFHIATPADGCGKSFLCRDRNAYSDVLRADADVNTSSRPSSPSSSAATEQSSLWPAGVRPFRVLATNDSLGQLRCTNMCCSAIRRSRTLKLAKAAEGIALLSRLRAALRSVLRRCLAAVASTAVAEPEGPGTDAAAAAAAAAAVWNSQPLVVDAYSQVFSDACKNSAEAAAALLDWFALRLTEGLTVNNTSTSTSTMAPPGGTSACTASAEHAPPPWATLMWAARGGEVEGERQESGDTVATNVTGRRPADLSACKSVHNEGTELWHDVLLGVLGDYAALLRGKDAEAIKCTDRMIASLGAARRMSGNAIPFSGCFKGRICHRRVDVLSSRVRLLLELLTNALYRSSFACKREYAFQNRKHILQQQEGETLRGGHMEQPLLQQLLRGKQRQQDGWSFFSDKLVAASVISLVFCWKLRRCVRHHSNAASSVSPLSWTELGESYVWGDFLRPAFTRATSAVNSGAWSLSNPGKLRSNVPCVTEGSSLSCFQSDACLFPTATVEEALEESPLGCVLSSVGITPQKRPVGGLPGINNSSPARPLSSGSAAGLRPSDQQPFAAPIFICRRHPNMYHDGDLVVEPHSKKSTFRHDFRGTGCYSLHVIRPALTAAERTDWQLQHTLKEIVSDMATAAVAVAAEEGGKKRQDEGGCFTPVLGEKQKSHIREAKETAEADADHWALDALMMLSDRAWRAPLQAGPLMPATVETTPVSIVANSGAETSRDFRFSQNFSRSRARQVCTCSTGVVPKSGYTGVAFIETGETETRTPLSGVIAPFSVATEPAEEPAPTLEDASDAEISTLFLVRLFREGIFHPDSAEEVKSCYNCSRSTSAFKSIPTHTPQQREEPSDSIVGGRATATMQRQKEEILLERLQHVLDLRRNRASWRLAVAGSLLRLGMAAWKEGQKPEGQAHRQPQQERQAVERRSEGVCTQQLHAIADRLEKKLSTGQLGADDVTHITAQTGTFAQRGPRYSQEEQQRYATSTSEVWGPLQAILEARSTATASPSRGYQIFLANLLRCTFAALAPVTVAGECSEKSCGASRAAAVPAGAGPAAVATKGHSGIEAVLAEDDLMDLLRSIRWNALLPVFLRKHISLQGCAHRAAVTKDATSDGCRGHIQKTLGCRAVAAAAIEKQHSPLHLDTVCAGGAVLLRLSSQAYGFCTIDTLSDANASAFPRACFPQATAADDPAVTDVSTVAAGVARPMPEYAALVARRAAAAAVAVRVGMSCVDLLWRQRPLVAWGVSDSPFHTSCLRSVARETTQASDSGRLSVEEELMRSVRGSNGYIGSRCAHENNEVEVLETHLRGMTDDGERTTAASQQEMYNFFSFINSPVQHLVAEAIATGIAAQHELLCNLAAGISYLLHLRLHERRRQEQVDSEEQQDPAREERQQGMQGAEKEGQQVQSQGNERQSQIRSSISEGFLNASYARGSVSSSYKRMLAAPGVACDFLGGLSKTPVARMGGDCSTSQKGGEASLLQEGGDTYREGLAQEQLPTGNQHLLGGVTQCERTRAACSKNQLLSCILQAVDSSLPLAVGLRCVFCEMPKACISLGRRVKQQQADSLVQQPRQARSHRNRVTRMSVDPRSHSYPEKVTTAAADYNSSRGHAVGEAAADSAVRTCCPYGLTPAGDLKAARSSHEGRQLLLLLLFCEYNARRYLTSQHISNGNYRNRRRDSGKTETSTRTEKGVRECQVTKKNSTSDTDSYTLHPKSTHGINLTPHALPGRMINNTTMRIRPPATAARRVSWTGCGVPAADITWATPAMAKNFEEPESVLLLLPWLTRSLCECRLSETLLLSQRIRAARRLADVLSCSSSILHRLAAHSLRCWIYKQERYTLSVDLPAAVCQYLETTAAAWNAARLLTWLQQRDTALSHIIAPNEGRRLKLKEQLVSSAHDQQGQRQRDSCIMPCVECEKQVTWGEQQLESNQEQNWQRQGAGKEQDVSQQQDAEPQQEVYSDLTDCHRRGRHVVAENTPTTTTGAGNETSCRYRGGDANCWGFYAHLLHQSARKLQQSHAALATCELRVPLGESCDLSPVFEDEELFRTRQIGTDGEGCGADGRDNVGRGWMPSHEGAERECRTAGDVGADGAEAEEADVPGTTRISLAVALLRKAAQAATISNGLRRRSLLSATDGSRSGAQSSFRCAAAVHPVEHLGDGNSGRGTQKGRALAVHWHRFGEKPTLKRISGEALLRLCTQMLPSAFPDAEALWETALTAALHDGNIAAATKLLPRLRSSDVREKHLLYILAALLVQQSPGSPTRAAEHVRFHNASGSPTDTWVPIDAQSGTPRNSRRSCSSCRSSGYTSDPEPANRTPMAHSLHCSDNISLTALCAAAGSCQNRLFLEGILLRLSLAADCGREGPALAAFLLLKKDCLSSGRQSDAALLAFLHAAAIQTQLYTASEAQLGAVCSQEGNCIAAKYTDDVTAPQCYADATPRDDCFPLWLLRGLRQLHDVARYLQHVPQTPAFRTSPLLSCNKEKRINKSPHSGMEAQRNRFIRSWDEAGRDHMEEEEKREDARTGSEDYEVHIQLMEAAEAVRRVYLAFVADNRRIREQQQISVVSTVRASPSAHGWCVAQGGLNYTKREHARKAAARDAAKVRAARSLRVDFEKSLSVMENSASLCANLLLGANTQDSSSLSSYAFSGLLHTTKSPKNCDAGASRKILLLPSFLQPLLLSTSQFQHSLATRTVFLSRQKKRAHQQLREPQRCQRYDPDTLSRRVNGSTLDAALTVPQSAITTAQKTGKAAHHPSRETVSSLTTAREPAGAAFFEPPGQLFSTVLLRRGWTSAAAVAAEAVYNEISKYQRVSERPFYITASLARRIGAIAGAKLRLLRSSSSDVAALQQLLPWTFHAAETVANLVSAPDASSCVPNHQIVGFEGQLCVAVQLADMSHVDVFVAYAAFIAFTVTRQAADVSSVRTSGRWQLLVQQMRLRRAIVESGREAIAWETSDGRLTSVNERKVQLEAAVCALHSKLLKLLINIQTQSKQHGLLSLPSFVIEYMKQGELPADPVAALGRLLREGRLQEAFALVMREHAETEERRQQLGVLGQGTDWKSVLVCGSLGVNKRQTGRRQTPIETSAQAFLSLAWPLLIQLQAALSAEAAEQGERVALRAASGAATAANLAAPAKMHAILQGVLARYVKATRLSQTRDIQLVSLALKPSAPDVLHGVSVLENPEVADQPRSRHRTIMAT